MSELRQAINYKDKQKSAKRRYKYRMCSLHFINQTCPGFSCLEMIEML